MRSPFQLPSLDYALKDLEPHISEATMRNHYQHHHQTYINKLNDFIVNQPELAGTTLKTLIQKSQGPLFNNAAQHWNHNVFWKCLSNTFLQTPSSSLQQRIESDFGDLNGLLQAFKDSAAARFGSGWVWLILKHDNSLAVESTPNAQNPLTMEHAKATLLACDVWEHAYYLDTQYNRPAYVERFWNVVNWDYVSKNYEHHR